MKRPLIGVTIDCNDEGDRYSSFMSYAGGVERAGGLPLLVPYRLDHSLIPQLVDQFAGFLFTGGNDLDPVLYSGGDWHPKAVKVDPFRQNFELALMAEVEKRRLPTLGICLGSQLMNVHRGGSMIQFLPDAKLPNGLEHRRIPGQDPARHPVKLDTSTQLGQTVGCGKSEISVNTYHKQAVKKLGKGLKIIATAPDGVIEGFEDPTFPLFAAVQWHPERLLEEAEHLAPFKLLVEKSKK
jgi:putative glutamine amidotransferase